VKSQGFFFLSILKILKTSEDKMVIWIEIQNFCWYENTEFLLVWKYIVVNSNAMLQPQSEFKHNVTTTEWPNVEQLPLDTSIYQSKSS
jgi:hypothetical protein